MQLAYIEKRCRVHLAKYKNRPAEIKSCSSCMLSKHAFTKHKIKVLYINNCYDRKTSPSPKHLSCFQQESTGRLKSATDSSSTMMENDRSTTAWSHCATQSKNYKIRHHPNADGSFLQNIWRVQWLASRSTTNPHTFSSELTVLKNP